MVVASTVGSVKSQVGELNKVLALIFTNSWFFKEIIQASSADY